nr:PREDICTED: alpha-1B-glycoprotein-like isoform X2 [Lepisosteus oculatus]
MFLSQKDFLQAKGTTLSSVKLVLIFELLANAACSNSLPAPAISLAPKMRSQVLKRTVDILCQSPPGHTGSTFLLYKERQLIDSRTFSPEQSLAQFTLRGITTQNLTIYCCQYQSQQSGVPIYSIMSQYLSLMEEAPSVLPKPLMSVDPPGGSVLVGQTLSFRCTASQAPRQPEAFLLLKDGRVFFRHAAPAGLEESFTLKPVQGKEGGFYSCVYQARLPSQDIVNSTASDPVYITVSDSLAAPSLVRLPSAMQSASSVTVKCVGSPSYPGALFNLYRLGAAHPLSSLRATAAQHGVRFILPDPTGEYQCQYAVNLGQEWRESARSLPILIDPPGHSVPTEPSTPASHIDWALVAGSVSAGVLFVAILAILVFLLHRKVKLHTEKKRKREEALLWNSLHNMDNIIDFSLRDRCTPAQPCFHSELVLDAEMHTWSCTVPSAFRKNHKGETSRRKGPGFV